MLPNSAKAKQASSVMHTPTIHTARNSHGCRVLIAMFLAVRKMPEPMIPPASRRMESVRESPRTSLASLDNRLTAHPVWLRYNPVSAAFVKGLSTMVKPLYLLADSQLLFWKGNGDSLAERIREELETVTPRAAYVGASNGDQQEFYSLFIAAMETMGVSNCRMVPSQPSREDILFVEEA